MANYFNQLPAYRDPGALEFAPLNNAVQNFGETNRANAMAEYQAGQNRKAEARANAAAGRAQATFDAERGKEALNQLAGIYQSIEQAPEAERAALYERVRPLQSRLRTQIADFDTDLTAMGVDPNDHVAVGRIIMGRAAGYQDPRKVAEAPSNVREWDYFNRLTPDQKREYLTMKRADKYLDTGTEYTQPNPIAPGQNTRTVPKNVAGEEVAKGEGQNIAKKRAELPEARARLTLITGGLDRLENTATSLAKMPGLGNVVGGLYQALAPNVTEASLNAETELTNLKTKISGVVLQSMRDASKTGGAVGQVTEREWPRLENMIANLDAKQGKDQFLRNLQDVVTYAQGVKAALQQAYEADARIAEGGSQAPAAAPPATANGGWSIQRVD
jgi:hypothetical protein